MGSCTQHIKEAVHTGCELFFSAWKLPSMLANVSILQAYELTGRTPPPPNSRFSEEALETE